jgi:hypothetical protein
VTSGAEARVARQREFGALYEHLREWHGIAPVALANARTVEHLEEIHRDVGDDGCIW